MGPIQIQARQNLSEGVSYAPPHPDERPLEYRMKREELLRSNKQQFDERTPLEHLFDIITRARLTHYKPMQPAAMRGDIPCLCCGNLYRPDDPMDAVNLYLCLTCIRTQEETDAAGPTIP